MGSFRQTCMVSDLTIKKNKEVALFLLTKKRNIVQGKSRRSNHLISKINDLFDIFSMPIFGKYNGYGKITAIKKTESVCLLEKYFELPIKDILDYVCESYQMYYSCGSFFDKYAVFKEHKHDKITSAIFDEFLKKAKCKRFKKIDNETYTMEKENQSSQNLVITVSFKKENYKITSNCNPNEYTFDSLEKLCYVLDMQYDVFLYYKPKARKFIKAATQYHLEGMMVLKPVYEKLVTLANTDVQWYENHEDIESYRQLLLTNKQDYDKKANLIIEKEQYLKDNETSLSEKEITSINEEIKDYKFENRMMNLYGYCYMFDSYCSLEDRLHYTRHFNRIYNEEMITNDDTFKEFKDMMLFEISMDSLGKYYRKPGFTPQDGTKREKKYIQFLNTITEKMEE